jgi:hypothetical protein
MSKGTVIILVVIGCLLLAVANVALWVTLDVFNADRFGEHVAEGLQSEASTEALAVPIVDNLMVEYPGIPALLRGKAEDVVAYLLQGPLFTPIVEEAAAGANKLMTTSAQDVVGLDLAGTIENVGSTVVGVISAIDPEAGAEAQASLDAALDASEESGRLAIYEEGKFPGLRTFSNISPWLALLAGLGGIVLFVLAYMRAEDQHEALKYSGWGIMITAVLGFLLFTPVVQGTAQNNITNATMQVVVGEVVSSLLRGYAVQSLLLFFIGLILLVANHYMVTQADKAQASPQTDTATEQPA